MNKALHPWSLVAREAYIVYEGAHDRNPKEWEDLEKPEREAWIKVVLDVAEQLNEMRKKAGEGA